MVDVGSNDTMMHLCVKKSCSEPRRKHDRKRHRAATAKNENLSWPLGGPPRMGAASAAYCAPLHSCTVSSIVYVCVHIHYGPGPHWGTVRKKMSPGLGM